MKTVETKATSCKGHRLEKSQITCVIRQWLRQQSEWIKYYITFSRWQICHYVYHIMLFACVSLRGSGF